MKDFQEEAIFEQSLKHIGAHQQAAMEGTA